MRMGIEVSVGEGRGEGLVLGVGELVLPFVDVLPLALEVVLLLLFCRRCCSSCSINERRIASMTMSFATH